MNKLIAILLIGTLAAWVLSPGIVLAGEAAIANDVRVLKAITKCPETEPTCLVFHIDLVWPGKPAGWITDHPNVIRFVPPVTTTMRQLDRAVDILEHAIQRVT